MAKTGIFGSLIRGAERSGSDVAVLVPFRWGEETFDNYMDCKSDLEDRFGYKIVHLMNGAIKMRVSPFILSEVLYA